MGLERTDSGDSVERPKSIEQVLRADNAELAAQDRAKPWSEVDPSVDEDIGAAPDEAPPTAEELAAAAAIEAREAGEPEAVDGANELPPHWESKAPETLSAQGLQATESAGSRLDSATEQGLREVVEQARLEMAHRFARIDADELSRKAEGDPELLDRAKVVEVERVEATGVYSPRMPATEFADHLRACP